MSIATDVYLLRAVLTGDDENGEWDWDGPLPAALGRVLDLVEREALDFVPTMPIAGYPREES